VGQVRPKAPTDLPVCSPTHRAYRWLSNSRCSSQPSGLGVVSILSDEMGEKRAGINKDAFHDLVA
jgi:hypothetical protein